MSAISPRRKAIRLAYSVSGYCRQLSRLIGARQLLIEPLLCEIGRSTCWRISNSASRITLRRRRLLRSACSMRSSSAASAPKPAPLSIARGPKVKRSLFALTFACSRVCSASNWSLTSAIPRFAQQVLLGRVRLQQQKHWLLAQKRFSVRQHLHSIPLPARHGAWRISSRAQNPAPLVDALRVRPPGAKVELYAD